jgi:5-methylcytosine-specific restriction protein B
MSINKDRENAHQALIDFRNKWPLEKIKSLNIEEYVSNQQQGFCYDIEFNTPGIGSIRGGNSIKFGLYKRADATKQTALKNVHSDSLYVWHESLGSSSVEAFSTIKSSIIEIISLSERKDIDAVDQLNTPYFWGVFKWKLVFMYAPLGTIVDIFSQNWLKEHSKENTVIGAYKKIMNKYKSDQDIFDYSHEVWSAMNNNQSDKSSTEISVNEDENSAGEEKIKIKLNTILFGPPGTGKTYNTINHALSILMGKKIDELPTERSELINLYREYITNGQIVFTTFHQSYGYEEFIEGIKPDIDASENGEVRYKVEDGVFKSLCKTAISKAVESNASSFDEKKNKVWKFSLGSSQNGEDEVYYEEALKTDSIILGWGDKIDFRGCKNYDEIFERANSDLSTARFVNIFINEMKAGDIAIISDGNRAFKAIVEIIGDYYYDAESDLPQKRKIKWLKRFDKSRPYNDVSDKYFTQSTINRPNHINYSKLNTLLVSEEVDNSNKKFVIIIDEINRGNISKIFGELITLIEPSKRIGAEKESKRSSTEELRVSLPYSGNEFDGGKGFGVPSNVYIIGTMNTADRSIALMDTALRRRFEFIEMMPDYDVIEREVGSIKLENDKSINISELLRVINERISYLYDRDHQIGHAYFMSLKDEKITDKKAELDSIFKNKIIPLLQEYFYDDWEKIQIVLGDHDGQFDNRYKYLKNKEEDHRFIISHALKEIDVLGFDHGTSEESKTSYLVNAEFTANAYLKITGQLKSEITVNAKQPS